MKDASVIGAVTVAGAGIDRGTSRAETVDVTRNTEETERCPYFDQPLFCRGMTKNGKLLCDE